VANSKEVQTRAAPSPFRPRFTLAALLALVTLSALGAWYWWRVPFEREDPAGAHRTVETVRRVWGGKALRHGPLFQFDKQGRKLAEIYYREGQLHGPSQRWFADGHLREQGEHRLGGKRGEWTQYFRPYDRPSRDGLYYKAVAHWKDGTPNGTWEWFNPAGKLTLSMVFADGKLAGPLPEDAEAGIGRRLVEAEITDARLVEALIQTAPIEFLETPLKDALDFLQAHASYPLEIDALGLETNGISIDTPVTLTVPPEVPYIVTLGRILRPLKLTCDHRYGVIWVTTPERYARRDQSGLDDIKPPPGSRLAEVWDKPINMEFLETPLVAALGHITELTGGGMRFDLSHLPKNYHDVPVTRSMEQPPRHFLAVTLDELAMWAELEGETIVLKLREPNVEASVSDSP
jgi:hypothetical protein